MKRTKLMKYLLKNNCEIYREGRKHTVIRNIVNNRTSTVPRHKELKDLLCIKICNDLGISKIK